MDKNLGTDERTWLLMETDSKNESAFYYVKNMI